MLRDLTLTLTLTLTLALALTLTQVLRDGDIVNIDITCYFGGYHGECSEN